MDNESKTKLRDSLKSKIAEKSLKRSSNVRRDNLIDKNFKKMGIDKDKFQADLEAVKKQGGLSNEQIQQMLIDTNHNDNENEETKRTNDDGHTIH